jgi:hypothetical protein
LDIGSRLELFVDRYLIEDLQGARLKLHSPTPREAAIHFDAPWEGPTSTYATVLQDVDCYRAYFRGSAEGRDGFDEVTCYAESRDDIHWHKPALGICESGGSTQNNIVWDGYGCNCFMVFKDTNPSVQPDKLYKGLASSPPSRPNKRLVAMSSPDGLHWQPMQEAPVITQPVMDSGSDLAFWDPLQEQYVTYLRGWRTHRGGGPVSLDGATGAATRNVVTPEGIMYRQVMRATSPDFLHWSALAFIDFGDTPLEHFYNFVPTPYCRAPHIYLAFPKRFLPHRHKVPEHPHPGVSESVFLSSRDGVHWDRTFMEAFVRPGRDRENWTERNHMMASGVWQTAADELSIYWVEHYRHPTARLRRGTLRLDGFVSVNAGYAGGELVTKPLRFEGSELALNYATSAAGSVRVEVQDAEGRPIPGYTLEACVEMYGDATEQAVTWKGSSDVSHVAGEAVRLRFVMRDAALYAIRFR